MFGLSGDLERSRGCSNILSLSYRRVCEANLERGSGDIFGALKSSLGLFMKNGSPFDVGLVYAFLVKRWLMRDCPGLPLSNSLDVAVGYV